MNLFGDSFIRWRATEGEDKYGNPILVWDETGKQTISGVCVQPAYSKDASEPDRIIGILGLTIIGPVGVDLDVLKTDRILYGDVDGSTSGNWYTVEGEITRYHVGGTLHHVTIRAKKVSG